MTTAEPEATRPIARRSAVFWGVAALFVALLAALEIAVQAALLTFAGILFGTALRGLAEVVARKTRWRLGVALAACIVGLAALTAAAFAWMVPAIADQASELAARVVEAATALRERVSSSPLLSRVAENVSGAGKQFGELATRAAGILASFVGGLGALLFVLFISIYVATGAPMYRAGLVKLVPPAHRPRAEEVVDTLASTLRRWLLGRIVSMTAVGVATGIGLWALGIPLPFTLALIAGLFGFVPNVGPAVSAIPALLLASTGGMLDVVWVAVLYLGINLADGYLLTPAIEKRAVAVPPAVVLTSQVVFGALWGVLGVTFATPLVACLVVLTKEIYVHDVLERRRTPAPAAG